MIDINNVPLREKFLKAVNCTLEDALLIAQKKNVAAESVRIQNKGFLKLIQPLLLLHYCDGRRSRAQNASNRVSCGGKRGRHRSTYQLLGLLQ